MLGSDVLADGVVLVAMDAALSLLKVDRVVGEIPVDDCVGVVVEVKALLAD